MSTYRHVADSAPYYDDYVGSNQEDKGYVKVLWKPSRAVQARELTQMQTYAQKQIAEMGGYMFKDGTVVHGAVISTTTKQKYFIAALNYPTGMTLEDAMAGFMAYNKDKASVGIDGIYDNMGLSNLKFQLVGWETYDEPDQVTVNNPVTGVSTTMVVVFYNIFGNTFADSGIEDGYVSSRNRESALAMVFDSGTNSDVTLKVTHFFKEMPASKDDIYLTCTRAFCNRGTIFVDGYFVNCPYGAVLVNPIVITTIDNTPAIRVKEIGSEEEYHIGFWIDRKIVDAYEDPTLTDPASGTYNHKSSGADRYSILANLICLTPERMKALDEAGLLRISSNSDNSENAGATEGIKFVTGIIMRDNIVIKEQSNVGANSELMDEMARRTYEESGSYTVTPWKVQIENCTKKDEDGFEKDVPNKYEVAVNPGLGYIYGYRVSTCVSQKLENDRARTKMIRPVSTKYTEKSLSVATDNLYTLDDARDNASWNTHSRFLNRVLEAGRVVLLDIQISELVKKHEFDDFGKPTWHSIITPTEVDFASKYNEWKETGMLHELGTASVCSVAVESDNSLRLWLLDVEGVSNLSDVSCIASFASDENGNLSLSGYVDLLHQGEDNITVWSSVEEPLIFETDWPSVAPDKNTYAVFSTENTITSSSVRTISDSQNENKLAITFIPSGGESVPTSKREINYLVNIATGETIPISKFDFSDHTTESYFELIEYTPGTFKTTAYNSYVLSYQGLTAVAEAEESVKGFSYVSGFKKKTLRIGTCTVTPSDLSSMMKAYKDDPNSADTLLLVDDEFGSLTNAKVRVTDLVKILAIEEKAAGVNSQTTTDAPEEIYWNNATPIAAALTIDDGCRDYCYQQSSIKGLGKYYYNKDTTNSTNLDSTSASITIVFAYWRHSSSNGSGFYYSGSYETHENVQFESMQRIKNDATGINLYKRRLAEWYNVDSIAPILNEEESSYDENAWRLIPKYKAKSGAWYDLTNCFDFRPDWFGTGRLAPSMPLPSTLMTYQVATYLPRIDTVWVDKDGEFGISKGTPSDNPVAPKTKDGTLVLYNIYNKPYGKTLGDIVPSYLDNRRHTMIDITAIANRLANLEEVVSMSMAEQSAANMQIVDEDGVNRYKCGIFTDSFGSFENCGYSEADWKATIDTVEKCIRPDFELKNWGFSLLGSYVKEGNAYALKTPMLMNNIVNNSTTVPINVEVYGKHKLTQNGTTTMVGGTILTLKPVKNQNWRSEGLANEYQWVYAKNDSVTETVNVQSVMFVVWNGNLVLTPAIDTWTNDKGEIVTETWEDSEQPPDAYRSWTTTTDGTVTQSTVKQTLPSGISYQDLDKLYGKNWRDVPKAERVTHLPGWWEPATTLTEIATYKTVTATKVTEKTTYTGSWQANDVSTYMESQDDYMRIRKVKFDLEGMRPNQTFKASMDKVPLKLLTVKQFNNPNLPASAYLDEIQTDAKGNAVGYFVVPDKMPVGTKVVEFYDGEETSAATAEYTANGKTVWTKTERKYIRVWTAETSQTYGEPSTTIGKKINSQMVSTATAIFHNEDPIAESFYVEEEAGITLESIDIFFSAKDPSVGVEIFIVECENGYPGQTVVPFSRVFVPSEDVAVTPKDAVGKNNPPAPTNFKFSVPLQLQGSTEYAFVVIAPSYTYELYTSTLGASDLVTGNGVREQPYTGTMYKSQNLRTWAAEPMSDVAFRLYRYKFDVNTPAVADFALDDLIALNTGIESSLPPEKGSTEDSVDVFRANSMNISAGTYMPAGTSIRWSWYTGTDHTKAVSFENKQDIFLDSPNGMAMHFNFDEESSSSGEYINNNSSLYVRATLSTTNENIAPQIDLEDFCGIFTRNNIATSDDDVKAIINGIKYYDAGTYLSNTIALKDPAIGLKVAVDAMLPNSSILKAYFKAYGSSSSVETTSTPGLSGIDSMKFITGRVNNVDVGFDLPGAKLGSIDEVVGQRSYIWYYIKDLGDQRAKFILPYQMAYYNSSSANYSNSSCILELPVQKNAGNESEYAARKLVMKDPINLNILPTPTFNTEVAANGTVSASVSWTSNSNAIIYGVYAMPLDEGSGKLPALFNPDVIASLERNNNANFAGIECGEYDPEHVYEDNELCLYDGEFWKCVRGGSVNLAPAMNVLNWEKMPCVLFVSQKTTETAPEAQWIELKGDDYKPSTERETNFMEYSYATTPAMELNEFDSFMLKIEMLSVNTKDVPRFRNLRTVAVY